MLFDVFDGCWYEFLVVSPIFGFLLRMISSASSADVPSIFLSLSFCYFVVIAGRAASLPGFSRLAILALLELGTEVWLPFRCSWVEAVMLPLKLV